MQLTNRRTRQTILQDVIMAKSILSRLKGLLFTRKLGKSRGLCFRPCKAVHTLGMRYAIDVIFLDDKNRVLKMIPSLEPNRFSSLVWNAHSVLETPNGLLGETDIRFGDQLDFQ